MNARSRSILWIKNAEGQTGRDSKPCLTVTCCVRIGQGATSPSFAPEVQQKLRGLRMAGRSTRSTPIDVTRPAIILDAFGEYPDRESLNSGSIEAPVQSSCRGEEALVFLQGNTRAVECDFLPQEA